MKLATLYFDWPESNNFYRLTRAFTQSCLDLGISPDIIMLGEQEKGKRNHIRDNTIKFRAWTRYLEIHPDEEIIMMDSDMILTNNPFHVFEDKEFDIVFTDRTKLEGYNTGVVFIRNNFLVRRFLKRWYDNQEKMYTDSQLRDKWYKKYRGINQAALMYTIQNGGASALNIKTLPCAKYNACNDDWRAPAPDGRVAVHYFFGDLRHAVLTGDIKKKSNRRRHQRFLGLVDLWKRKEEKAIDSELDIKEFKIGLPTEVEVL